MENWCYHKPTLLGMTRHDETGQRMPDELFDKLQSARHFRAASQSDTGPAERRWPVTV